MLDSLYHLKTAWPHCWS